MTASEFFRRGVIAPLSQSAAKAMRDDLVDSMNEFDYVPIEDDQQFERLWQSGHFQEINKSCGLLIDDYEEETAPPATLVDVVKFLNQASLDQAMDKVDREAFAKIATLAISAEARKMPIKFIF